MNIQSTKQLKEWLSKDDNLPTPALIKEVEDWIELSEKTHATSNVDIAKYFSALYKKHVEPGSCGGCNNTKYTQIKDFVHVYHDFMSATQKEVQGTQLPDPSASETIPAPEPNVTVEGFTPGHSNPQGFSSVQDPAWEQSEVPTVQFDFPAPEPVKTSPFPARKIAPKKKKKQ